MQISNSSNFCIVPWVHMYYFTDGKVYPCPALAGDPSMVVGAATQDPKELWNSTTLKKMRQSMINNIPINQCIRECGDCISSCKKYFGNDLLSESAQNINNTNEDGSCDFNFVAWNLIESNLCNLKCTYCASSFSNLWDDNKTVVRPLPLEELKQMYNTAYNTVSEIWFASGEPVVQESTYYFLNKLLSDNKTDVRIRFITNLMKTSYKSYKIYDILEKFNDVIVFGSWDLDGNRGEYIRKNSNSNTIKNTIRIINNKNIKFILQSVMSIFNLYYYPDFHRRLYEENLVKKDNVRYYNLSSPEKYRYSILPTSIKDKIKHELLSYIEWLKKDTAAMDFYANKEHPADTINKIINVMYHGGDKHINFDKKQHSYYSFLKESFIKDKTFKTMFAEILI